MLIQNYANELVLQIKKPKVSFEIKDQPYLLVDGLNFLDLFFEDPDFWKYDWAFDKIQEFVIASRKSGYLLEVFLDAERHTDQTQDKWRKKREAEIANCQKPRPICLTNLYGDFWRKLGVKVHYSVIDKDDTIASYAQYFEAKVLSADKDLQRYRNRKYKVYNDYKIRSNGCLNLQKAKKIQHKKPRDLIYPLPITYQQFHIIPRLFKNKQFITGISTPFMKYTGNLYLLIQPLRQVFYAFLGINFQVKEVYPSWDSVKKQVNWIEELVTPADLKQLQFFIQILLSEDNIYLILYHFCSALVKPTKCNRHDDIIWLNHIYCYCAVISELLAFINLKPLKYYLDKCKEFALFLDRHLNNKINKIEESKLTIPNSINTKISQKQEFSEENKLGAWQVSSTTRRVNKKQHLQEIKQVKDSYFIEKLEKMKAFFEKLEDPRYKIDEEDIQFYIKKKQKAYRRYLGERNYGYQDILQDFQEESSDESESESDQEQKDKKQQRNENQIPNNLDSNEEEEEQSEDFWDNI
eukprot:403351342